MVGMMNCMSHRNAVTRLLMFHNANWLRLVYDFTHMCHVLLNRMYYGKKLYRNYRTVNTLQKQILKSLHCKLFTKVNMGLYDGYCPYTFHRL